VRPIAPERAPEVDQLLRDLDRLAAANRQLRARVEALESVEVAAHRLPAAKPAADRDARERLWQAMARAEGVSP